MQTTEDRIRQLITASVVPEKMSPRIEDWLSDMKDFTLADLGISSVEGLALIRKVEAEFGLEIPVEEAEKLGTLGDLSSYIKSRA